MDQAGTLKPNLTVERVAISALRPNPDNPRSITEERFKSLVKAIQSDPDMFYGRPLVVLPDGVVIAGNMRLRAALELGWETVPAIIVERDINAAALWALRDNNEYGEWDEQMLAEQLWHLKEASAELDLAGFDEKELQRLLDSVGGLGLPEGADDVPELPTEAVTQPGELIELGDHLLYCGNAFDEEALDRLFAGGLPKAIVNDPPYGIDLDTDYSGILGSKKASEALKGKGKAYRAVEGDNEPFNATPLVEYFQSVSEQFWFGGDYYRRTLSPSDLDGAYLVWDKRNDSTDKVIGSGFELIWTKQPHKRDLLRHYYCGAFGKEAANRVHPTQKPTGLIEEILRRWTKRGDVIADLFAGSGTTLIAAERLGRKARVMEIDPRYCDVIKRRYEEYTAK